MGSVPVPAPYSPDLNPIEMAFAKLKAHLRARAEGTIDAVCRAIGQICDLFQPDEAETTSSPQDTDSIDRPMLHRCAGGCSRRAAFCAGVAPAFHQVCLSLRAVDHYESGAPVLVPELFLGSLQQFIRVDADRAADCDVFGWIEQPAAGFVRRDEPLGLAKAFCQLGLGQALF
jgi:hypothetical protein